MKSLIQKLRDWTGINKYWLAWDFVTKNGSHLIGSEGPYSKWLAARMAAGMNEKYGVGTHWIEPRQ